MLNIFKSLIFFVGKYYAFARARIKKKYIMPFSNMII